VHRLLQNNAISGSIPSTIGKLVMLKTLAMSDNQLTGSIPNSIGNLKNLDYL
jgi:Leucine-rich repeat (LRR) protein